MLSKAFFSLAISTFLLPPMLMPRRSATYFGIGLAVRAAEPATRATFTLQQIFLKAFDIVDAGLHFLKRRNPTNPLVTGERCKAIPEL